MHIYRSVCSLVALITMKVRMPARIRNRYIQELLVSLKHHNRKLQTNPWHREEEPRNNHETPGRQTKQSNTLSLPNQDDCKTRRDLK